MMYMTVKEIIDHFGGPSKFAERLGFNRNGGAQRVFNWTRRGVPAAILKKHPRLFKRKKKLDTTERLKK